MHVEYWVCDRCKKVIDYDEKKFTTKEMGYPFIPKGGGGKHYHYQCLLDYYAAKKDLTNEKRAELIADAERRHEAQLIKKKIKQGNLTKGRVETRKSNKKDREALFNYFYDFYGLRGVTKRLNTIIDKLNAGEDFGEISGVQISYDTLKKMLLYYRKDLNNIYKNKQKKDGAISAIQRIFYDVMIMVNSYDDYLKRPEVLYNQTIHNQVDGGEKIYDNSKLLVNRANKKDDRKEQMLKDIDEFLDSLDDNLED